MGNIYVRSGAGGTATGASWANACLTLAAGITASAAGDDIWVSEDHSETIAAQILLLFKGTTGSPNRVICVNHSGSVPPVAADVRTTAIVANSGGNNIAIAGFIYVYGITFNCSTGAASGILVLALGGGGRQVYDTCVLNAAGTSGAGIDLGDGTTSSLSSLLIVNTAITFGSTTGTMRARGGVFKIVGGSVAATGSVPTTMVTQTHASSLVLDGVDLSGFGSGKTLIGAAAMSFQPRLINCRLGTSVTVAATPTSAGGSEPDLIVADSSTSSTRQERYRYAGTLTTETTIVRTSGASDGTTPISWKVVTTANVKLIQPFECFETAIWNATTGSSKTVTVEIVNDGTTLTDAEAWIEAEYLGSSSYPLATMISSRAATVLTTGANLSTSSVTWTTTGLSSPVKQKMSVTFTPQMVGLIRVRIYLARASKTVYVDPKLTVT